MDNQRSNKADDNKRELLKLQFEASVFEANSRSYEKKKQEFEIELARDKKKRDHLDSEIKSKEIEIKRLENELIVYRDEAKQIRRKINMLT